MISIDEQIRIATDYVTNIANGGIDEKYYADDMTAWSQSMGMRGRDWYLPKLVLTKLVWKTPLTMKIDSTTAQPGRVVLQTRSHGVLFTGEEYSNEYLFLIEFNDRGQIRHVREYFNLVRLNQILKPAMAKWEAMQAATH